MRISVFLNIKKKLKKATIRKLIFYNDNSEKLKKNMKFIVLRFLLNSLIFQNSREFFLIFFYSFFSKFKKINETFVIFDIFL